MAPYILGSAALLAMLIVTVLFVAAARRRDETLSNAFSVFALASSAAAVSIFAFVTWLARIWPETFSMSPAGILASTIPPAMLLGLWIVARRDPCR